MGSSKNEINLNLKIKSMKKTLIALCCIGMLSACKNENKKDAQHGAAKITDSKNTKAEEESPWISLFNGESADGWRAYNGKEGESLPSGWVIENGTLKSLGKGGDLGGDIIYSKEKFDEFELELQWKLSEGGNSGIFYHVVEDSTQESPYWAAPEYQIIDQIGFPQKLEPWQSIGADYGMYNPNYSKEDLKPIGQWNTSKIRPR